MSVRDISSPNHKHLRLKNNTIKSGKQPHFPIKVQGSMRVATEPGNRPVLANHEDFLVLTIKSDK